MKEIKDYLQYYIGQRMEYATHHEPQDETYILDAVSLSAAIEFGDRPILRRLEDITPDETVEWNAKRKMVKASPVHVLMVDVETPDSFHYCLSKGFDLFGLIDAGLAIDSKTLHGINT